MLVAACGRKASQAITADPSAKSTPSTTLSRSDAVAVYRLVLRDHFPAPTQGSRVRVIDALAVPSCGTPETITSSMPTVHTDTVATFGRLPSDQLLQPFAGALQLDLLPLGDAIRLLAAAPTPGTTVPAGWPGAGLVRFTPIAFDSARSDALVSFEHWATPSSRQASVIHLVRRDGTWFEQEILRCP